VSSEGHKALAFGVATLALVVSVLVIGPRLLGVASGPENELVLTLKKLERTGLDLVVEGKPLRGAMVQFQRLAVQVEPSGQRAVATGTLDLNGTYDRDTVVSSLGFEEIPFVLQDGSWDPVKGLAPRLTAILAALERRRRALDADESADGGEPMLHRHYRVAAWYIRSERESAQVAEDFVLTGETRDRPVDEKRTVRLTLEPGPDGTFVIRGETQ
jgi:hypothetical protein